MGLGVDINKMIGDFKQRSGYDPEYLYLGEKQIAEIKLLAAEYSIRPTDFCFYQIDGDEDIEKPNEFLGLKIMPVAEPDHIAIGCAVRTETIPGNHETKGVKYGT